VRQPKSNQKATRTSKKLHISQYWENGKCSKNAAKMQQVKGQRKVNKRSTGVLSVLFLAG